MEWLLLRELDKRELCTKLTVRGAAAAGTCSGADAGALSVDGAIALSGDSAGAIA